jgi:Arc/MetJ-type ribon-helix-helix transcriptional regulator
MTTIALRIPSEMKKEMDSFNMNWSEYIRQAIQEVLTSRKKRQLIQEIQKITGEQKRFPKGTSVSLIREMRKNG